jgi:hypothetical protein
MTGRIVLLSWQPIANAGALVGRCTIALSFGSAALQISDCAVFQRPDGGRWIGFPAELMRDSEGQPLLDDKGRKKYKTSLRWATRDHHSRWSEAVLDRIDDWETAERGKPAWHGPANAGR